MQASVVLLVQPTLPDANTDSIQNIEFGIGRLFDGLLTEDRTKAHMAVRCGPPPFPSGRPDRHGEPRYRDAGSVTAAKTADALLSVANGGGLEPRTS